MRGAGSTLPRSTSRRSGAGSARRSRSSSRTWTRCCSTRRCGTRSPSARASSGRTTSTAGRLVDVLAGIPGLTVVASTHNLSMATELGDRAVLLAPGRSGALYDGDAHALLHDEALLVESGLAHRHAHRHGGAVHAHY